MGPGHRVGDNAIHLMLAAAQSKIVAEELTGIEALNCESFRERRIQSKIRRARTLNA